METIVRRSEVAMPEPHPGSSPAPVPAWALRQATEDLYDVHDPEAIAQRAREITCQAQEREDERHDEYDDPDQGGEA